MDFNGRGDHLMAKFVRSTVQLVHAIFVIGTDGRGGTLILRTKSERAESNLFVTFVSFCSILFVTGSHGMFDTPHSSSSRSFARIE